MHNGMTLTHIQRQGHRDPNALAEVDRQSPYGANFSPVIVFIRHFNLNIVFRSEFFTAEFMVKLQPIASKLCTCLWEQRKHMGNGGLGRAEKKVGGG